MRGRIPEYAKTRHACPQTHMRPRADRATGRSQSVRTAAAHRKIRRPKKIDRRINAY